MPTTAQCVSQIRSVADAASDARSAYLIRTRLKRSILSTVRMVAETEGLEKPLLPGPVRLDAEASPRSRELVELCNGIMESAEHLCQPSEALDVRWQAGWSKMSVLLNDLEQRLLCP